MFNMLSFDQSKNRKKAINYFENSQKTIELKICEKLI